MAKKGRLLFLLALCGMLSLTGCRKKAEEAESETQTVSETESESETEKKTEKTTEKGTRKTTENNTASTDKKTTVKASTKTPSTTGTTPQTGSAAGTAQCPYCYQQISTASNGDGTTVYSVHVAQEKAWADMYGYGDTPPANQQQTDTQQQTNASQTETPPNTVDDSQQCGYCYQWFSVSDGSYAAHLAEENAALGLPQGTEYIQCPTCGYSFPKGSLYDNHVCITN